MLILEKLQVGDVLAFKPRGFLGKAIKFFTAGDYAHIGVVYTPKKEFEMGGDIKNAKAVFREMKDLLPEAADIDVLRVNYNGKFIFESRAKLRYQFQQLCELRKGQPYAFKRIGKYAISGLLMKIPGISWLMKKFRGTDAPAGMADVCSDLVAEVIQIPIRKLVDPDFDLIPGVGENRVRPADFSKSPWLEKIC